MSKQAFPVLKEQRGPVLVLTMDRPQAMNSLSRDLLTGLAEALDEARTNDSVRAVVITGNGKAFCGGADITELPQLLEATPADPVVFDIFFDALERFGKPTIAAVNGLALGGGLELVLACDTAIAAQSAIFGLPEVKLGVLPGAGGTQRLVHAIGKAKALKLLMTGENVDAHYAHDTGVIAEVTDDGAVVDRAIEIAEEISANAPLAVQLAADAARQANEVPLSKGLVIERRNFQLLTKTDDAQRGIQAFLDRSQAEFTGR